MQFSSALQSDEWGVTLWEGLAIKYAHKQHWNLVFKYTYLSLYMNAMQVYAYRYIAPQVYRLLTINGDNGVSNPVVFTKACVF